MSDEWATDIQSRKAHKPVLICFSHLRWDFVFQRPQQLLTRASAEYTVVYFEEPVFADAAGASHLTVRVTQDGIVIATPVLPSGLDAIAVDQAQQVLLDRFLVALRLPVDVMWYYTPMAFGFSSHVRATTVVYDCMDELTLFRGASPRLKLLERRLLRRADLVFCGGNSLYQSKRQLHAQTYLFASSVDTQHFARARDRSLPEPADQAGLRRPCIGFFGVIDERMDYALVEAVAQARPEWSLVMIGPLAKVEPADLPQGANLHWLGGRQYEQLPAYLAGWDVGMMPFARNEATRFISPTKTPEYLASGVKLVSTSIADVVTDWSDNGLVEIADTPGAFVAAIERLLISPRSAWLAEVDRKLAGISWDSTWAQMQVLILGTANGGLKLVTECPAHAQ